MPWDPLKKDNLLVSECVPVCYLVSSTDKDAAQISIDRDDQTHGQADSRGEIFAANQPEVATLKNLIPGSYAVYVNAYPPDDSDEVGVFETDLKVDIWLGDGLQVSAVCMDTCVFVCMYGRVCPRRFTRSIFGWAMACRSVYYVCACMCAWGRFVISLCLAGRWLAGQWTMCLFVCVCMCGRGRFVKVYVWLGGWLAGQ